MEKALKFACNYLNLKTLPIIEYYQDFDKADCLGEYIPSINTIKLYCDNVETLFHELVHYKQLEMGWLKTDGSH